LGEEGEIVPGSEFWRSFEFRVPGSVLKKKKKKRREPQMDADRRG
jgi:hypothetical protein